MLSDFNAGMGNDYVGVAYLFLGEVGIMCVCVCVGRKSKNQKCIYIYSIY